MAVDLGTTKIAAYLLDLTSGKTLASEGVMNPQISYGEDTISRITYAMGSPAKAAKLQEAVVKALNQLIANLCKKADDPHTQEWWKIIMPMQEPLPTRRSDEWWAQMEEVFHPLLLLPLGKRIEVRGLTFIKSTIFAKLQ